MAVPEFLKFEKKKAILPIFLVLLLSFVIIVSNTYSAQMTQNTNDVVDYTLNLVKLAAYNASLKGTEPSIENELAVQLEKRQEIDEKTTETLYPVISSYGLEYVLNTFGTNFCQFSLIQQSDQKLDCVATKLDLAVPYEAFRLMNCLGGFRNAFKNDSIYPLGKKNNTEEVRTFILSERGQNIFNDFEGCGYSSIDAILDYQKMKEMYASNTYLSEPYNEIRTYGSYSPLPLEPPKINLITPLDVTFYIIILIVVGYLLSCVIIWIHRKNKILQGRGKKIYVAIILFFALFMYIFLFTDVRSIFTGSGITYIFFNLPDYLVYYFPRIAFALSLIFSYLATTAVWWTIGTSKENKITKKVGQYKRKRR